MQKFYRNPTETLWSGSGQPVQKRMGTIRTSSQYLNKTILVGQKTFFVLENDLTVLVLMGEGTVC